MQVSDILKTKGDRVVSIAPSATVSAVAKTLRLERIGALLVKDEGGRLAGIISERDIVRSLAEHGPAALDLPDLSGRSPEQMLDDLWRRTLLGEATDSLQAELALVRRAEEKLSGGDGGRCDVCGGEIGAARLEALPWAVRCVDCTV